MTKSEKKPAKAESVTINVDNIESIFVDKIVNIGVGFHVTRLTLTQDVADGSSKAFANLIMPTTSLFDFIKFMSENIIKNDELKQGLVKSMDEFKNQLTASEEMTKYKN